MHLLFCGKLQDEGTLFDGEPIAENVALEEGYLEKLFLKESKEQGEHFDAPESVSKIVSLHDYPVDGLSPISSRLTIFPLMNCLFPTCRTDIKTSMNSFIANSNQRRVFLRNQIIPRELCLVQIAVASPTLPTKSRHTGSRSISPPTQPNRT